MTGSDPLDSVHDDLPEDDDGPELIVCPQCAHPNLAVRTHCRRCSGRLSGTSNLIPGAELVEWSPTDGTRAPSVAIAPLRVLMMMAALFGLIFTAYAIQERSATALFFGLAPLIGAAIIESRIRAIQSLKLDTGSDESNPAIPCPECGEGVEAFDDVCHACGAVLVEQLDLSEPEPGE